jgi:hypothetical protein
LGTQQLAAGRWRWVQGRNSTRLEQSRHALARIWGASRVSNLGGSPMRTALVLAALIALAGPLAAQQ